MSIDNTHTKYLKGADKKAWNNYKEAYEAQQKLNNFMDGFAIPNDLQDDEEYEIPIHGNKGRRRSAAANKNTNK